MTLRILVTVPLATKGGGVSNYFRVVQDKLSEEVDYILRGSRQETGNWQVEARRLVGDYLRFGKQLRRRPYDLVHVNTSLGKNSITRDAVFILLAKLYRKKVLVFFHGWDPAFAHNMSGPAFSLFKFTYGSVDAMIVLASEFASTLEDWGIDKPIYVETTPVDDNFAERVSIYESSSIQASNRTSVNILFLARLEKEKGVFEALDAFRLLKSRNHPVSLLIAGDGSELSRLREIVDSEKEGGIIILGYVSGEKKLAAFKSADVYLFPSYHEGMPTTVLEAMAAALPVVTRPVGGLKDFFEDGKMGFWTESKDPVVFADLIERLLEDADRRNQIAQYNRSYAQKRFLASQVARRLENVYREVIVD